MGSRTKKLLGVLVCVMIFTIVCSAIGLIIIFQQDPSGCAEIAIPTGATTLHLKIVSDSASNTKLEILIPNPEDQSKEQQQQQEEGGNGGDSGDVQEERQQAVVIFEAKNEEEASKDEKDGQLIGQIQRAKWDHKLLLVAMPEERKSMIVKFNNWEATWEVRDCDMSDQKPPVFQIQKTPFKLDDEYFVTDVSSNKKIIRSTKIDRHHFIATPPDDSELIYCKFAGDAWVSTLNVTIEDASVGAGIDNRLYTILGWLWSGFA